MLSKTQRQEEIAARGYTLIDDSGYKNLESPITIKCSHGHLIKTTRKRFRRETFECPKCNNDIIVNPKVVPPKAAGATRVVAFDQATEHFGLSVFDNNKLVYYSLYTFKGTLDSRLVAITRMVRDIVIKEWQPDYICFEDIQYEKNIRTFKILAELIGIITELCKEAEIRYEIVMPNVWRRYANTAGKDRRTEKMLSVAKVKELYNIDVSDDVAEAILIGRYAVRRIGATTSLAFGY